MRKNGQQWSNIFVTGSGKNKACLSGKDKRQEIAIWIFDRICHRKFYISIYLDF